MAMRQPQSPMMRSAMKAPLLERVEEHDLAVRWKQCNDQQAMNKIVIAHMRLVISMASKFRSFGLSMNDLIQEGHVGLLEAASRFDPDRDVRFSTYATWWIRASIQDYVLRNWSIVRGGTSSTQKALFFNLRRLRARLAKGQEVISERMIFKNISEKLGVSEQDVELMNHRLSAPDSSLHAPMNADEDAGASRMDFLVDSSPLPDNVAESSIDDARRHEWMERALGVLNERELLIIRKRRLSDEVATLELLGEGLGISKERVRQIETRAFEKLRQELQRSNLGLALEAAGA